MRRAKETVRILLQTTTPGAKNDWSIESLSLLREHLGSLREDGCRFVVTARNRESGPNGDDPVLASLERSPFDELWLFALDQGEGMTVADCRGITRFRQRSGGLLTTRGHQDMGSSPCTLGGIGAPTTSTAAAPNRTPSDTHQDDLGTPSISWPNYHSGRNGDFQRIIPVEPPHELLQRSSSSGLIEFFPAHPHEGSVGVPPGEDNARTGRGEPAGRPDAHSIWSSPSTVCATPTATCSVAPSPNRAFTTSPTTSGTRAVGRLRS